MAYPMHKETNPTTWVKPKLIKWESKEMTLGEFFETYSQYDFDPIGQRPSTQTELFGLKTSTKAQGIIGAIMSGYDSGEIKVRLVIDEEGNILSVVAEAVDGSNRGRYWFWFRQGKFYIHESFSDKFLAGKKYNEMPEKAQEFWDNYKIRVIIYQNMSAREAGQQAKYCNTITVPNSQMLRNFDGDTPLANAIRDLVRAIKDTAGQHSLFPKSIAKNGKLVFDNLEGWDNDELDVEEKVAQIFYRYYSNKIHNTTFLGTAGQKQLNDLYADKRLEDQKLVDKIAQDVKNHLTYLKSIVMHEGRLRKGAWAYFSRLFFHMQDEFGKNVKIEDYELFYKAAYDAYVLTRDDINPDHLIQDDKGTRARGSAFKGYLAQADKNDKIKLSVEWALEHFDIQVHVKDLDPKRLFDRETTKAAWLAQDKKCWIKDELVDFENIVGGHIIAWSNKGRTVRENCRAIEETINLRQSNLDMEIFKKRYWRDKK